jgi:hypothetical protein
VWITPSLEEKVYHFFVSISGCEHEGMGLAIIVLAKVSFPIVERGLRLPHLTPHGGADRDAGSVM